MSPPLVPAPISMPSRPVRASCPAISFESRHAKPCPCVATTVNRDKWRPFERRAATGSRQAGKVVRGAEQAAPATGGYRDDVVHLPPVPREKKVFPSDLEVTPAPPWSTNSGAGAL